MAVCTLPEQNKLLRDTRYTGMQHKPTKMPNVDELNSIFCFGHLIMLLLVCVCSCVRTCLCMVYFGFDFHCQSIVQTIITHVLLFCLTRSTHKCRINIYIHADTAACSQTHMTGIPLIWIKIHTCATKAFQSDK